MTTHVITTPEVDTQVRTIDEWWRANRPAAPDLFTEELADCFALLEQLPNIGKRYVGMPRPPTYDGFYSAHLVITSTTWSVATRSR